MFLPGDGPARLGSRFFAAFGGFFVDASFAPPGLVCFPLLPHGLRPWGCILTPLPGLVDSRILVRLDRQIWFSGHILVQNFGQKNLASA
jgi:hypothetical protein